MDYNSSLAGCRLRYLFLTDIHSNLEALERCLALAEGQYDELICLGDLVGYGPDPNAVIIRLSEIARVIIRGNHDKACSGLTDAAEFNPLARLATDWTREHLIPEHVEFLRNLPTGPLLIDWFEVVHGAPIDEDEYILGPSQALPALRNLQVQAVFFGHTHYQGGFMLTPKGRFQSIRCASKQDGKTVTLQMEDGGRYVINPGSVGQPRDGDWRAGFCVLDADKRAVDYYRTPYDLATTQQKMRDGGLPDPLIRRLEFGR